MLKLPNLKPRINAVYLGTRPQQTNNRQATRSLNTNSAEWKRIRMAVLKRDLYRCQGYPKGQHTEACNGFATEVDHIDGDSSNNASDGSNFNSMSRSCHSKKTCQQEGGFGNL